MDMTRGNDKDIDLYGRNGKGHLGYTALLSSVQHRNYEMVYFLLQNGANPTLCLAGEIHSKANALHMAIMHYDGDVRIIDIILDHIGREGINKTISNCYGKQAMHWLTHICHEVIVAL